MATHQLSGNLSYFFKGCALYVQKWANFFLFFLNTTFFRLYISAHKKATAMVFFWSGSGYTPLRFEYKTASEGYLVTEILRKQFHQFHQFLNKKKWKSLFFRIYPRMFCLYLSDQISLRGGFVFKMNGRISTITS